MARHPWLAHRQEHLPATAWGNAMRRTANEEAERAAFYEQHQADAEMWGEPVEPPPTDRREGLAATITVRFSPEEAERIRRIARERHLTYSQVVREAVREYTHPPMVQVEVLTAGTHLPERFGRYRVPAR